MHLFDRIIVCAAACLTSAVCSATEPLPQSVLILDPFGGTLPWVGARNTAFRTALNAGRTVPISVYEEYLDFNRFAAPRYKESLISHFREKYRGKPIGMIISFGPLALDYAVGLRTELWPKAPVVFGEIAEGAISPSSLPAAVTGSTVHFTLREMVAAARALLPDLERIALVGDPLDQLPTHRHFKQEIPIVTRELEFIDLTGLVMAELRTRVTTLPDHTGSSIRRSISMEQEYRIFRPKLFRLSPRSPIDRSW